MFKNLSNYESKFKHIFLLSSLEIEKLQDIPLDCQVVVFGEEGACMGLREMEIELPDIVGEVASHFFELPALPKPPKVTHHPPSPKPNIGVPPRPHGHKGRTVYGKEEEKKSARRERGKRAFVPERGRGMRSYQGKPEGEEREGEITCDKREERDSSKNENILNPRMNPLELPSWRSPPGAPPPRSPRTWSTASTPTPPHPYLPPLPLPTATNPDRPAQAPHRFQVPGVWRVNPNISRVKARLSAMLNACRKLNLLYDNLLQMEEGFEARFRKVLMFGKIGSGVLGKRGGRGVWGEG